jgi:hypothetical protein
MITDENINDANAPVTPRPRRSWSPAPAGYVNGRHGWMHPAIRRPTPLEKLQEHCEAREMREHEQAMARARAGRKAP